MYIGCSELVFMQLKTTGWTTVDETKIVNFSHNYYGRLKMRLFWQRNELFRKTQRRNTSVIFKMLSILRLCGINYGKRMESEFGEFVLLYS
jgi:hypothetical protein